MAQGIEARAQSPEHSGRRYLGNRMRQTLTIAERYARDLNHHEIEPEHLILALLHHSPIQPILQPEDQIRRAVAEKIGNGTTRPSEIGLSERSQKLIGEGVIAAIPFKAKLVQTEHLGIAICTSSQTRQLLQEAGADVDKAKAYFERAAGTDKFHFDLARILLVLFDPRLPEKFREEAESALNSLHESVKRDNIPFNALSGLADMMEMRLRFAAGTA